MQLYAVEGNLRRTGGTHAHEAAASLLGPRYADAHTVLSRDDVRIEPLAGGWCEMQERASALLVSPSNGRTGIIPTVVEDIESGRLGYLVIAPTSGDAFMLARTC